MINLIWAQSKNNIIGKNNSLPWHYKEDFKYFKEMTTSSIVVMGRKTAESLSKPLPNRVNLVLTRDDKWSKKGFSTTTIENVINISNKKNVFIIGGLEIYNLFMPYANKLLVTLIKKDYDGDTMAPMFDKNKYTCYVLNKVEENNVNLLFLDYTLKVIEKN